MIQSITPEELNALAAHLDWVEPAAMALKLRRAAEEIDRRTTHARAAEVHVMKYHTCSSGEECPLLP